MMLTVPERRPLPEGFVARTREALKPYFEEPASRTLPSLQASKQNPYE